MAFHDPFSELSLAVHVHCLASPAAVEFWRQRTSLRQGDKDIRFLLQNPDKVSSMPPNLMLPLARKLVKQILNRSSSNSPDELMMAECAIVGLADALMHGSLVANIISAQFGAILDQVLLAVLSASKDKPKPSLETMQRANIVLFFVGRVRRQISWEKSLTNEMIRNLYRKFVRLLVDYGHGLEEEAAYAVYSGLSRLFYIFEFNDQKKEYHRIGLSEIQGNVDSFSSMCISHFALFMKKDTGEHQYRALYWVIKFLLGPVQVTDSTDPMTEALLRNGVIKVICRVFRSLSAKIPSGPVSNCPDDQHIQELLGTCWACVEFIEAIIFFRTVKWLNEIVKRDFIESLTNFLQGYKFFTPTQNTDTKSFLSTSLTAFIMSPVGVPFVVKAFNAIPKEVHLAIARTIFKHEWLTFQNFILERFIVYVINLMNEKEHGVTSRCNNPNCDVGKSYKELRRCAGCGAAVYCSKDCQVFAWKNGHRIQCNDFRSSSEREGLDGGFVLHYRALQFTMLLMTYDLERHAPAYAPMIKEKYPHISPSEHQSRIAYIVNHASMPPTIDVCTIEELRHVLERDALLRGDRCLLAYLNQSIRRAGERQGIVGVRKAGRGRSLTASCIGSIEPYPWPRKTGLPTKPLRMPGTLPDGTVAETTRDYVDDILLRTGLTVDSLLEPNAYETIFDAVKGARSQIEAEREEKIRMLESTMADLCLRGFQNL